MIRTFKFILVILCMLIIFSFSSDTGVQSNKKSDMIVNIVEKIMGNKFSKRDIKNITFIVRKTAHFTIYFILVYLESIL